MKSIIQLWAVAVLVAIGGWWAAPQAKEVTSDEARLVAENFVKMMDAKRGSWGEYENAGVASVDVLRRGDRQLGFFCPVEPAGFVVVSLYREMAPVQAYSMKSKLNPDDDQLGDVIKVFHEMVLDGLAEKHGRPIAADDDLSAYLPVQFDEAWDALLVTSFNAADYREEDRSRALGLDYEEGEQLLDITWDQGPPYNNYCPMMGCEWAFCGYCNWNAVTGCVATAGAMAAKYWNWPPTGVGTGYNQEWDWPHMGARYTYDPDSSAFRVEHIGGGSEIASQAQLDAVSLISGWMGVAVGMDYGCDGSGAPTLELANAMPDHFRYSTAATDSWREDHTYDEWLNTLTQQLDQNRPMPYRIPGHAVVADGWDEDLGVYYFHFVYGHNGGDDLWCTTGTMPGGGSTSEHYVVLNLYPINCVGGTPLGSYSPPTNYPYRYLNSDIFSLEADFESGHTFQVLGSGLLIETWDSDPSLGIRFHGAPGAETAFYMNGDPDDNTRIRIHDGTISMTQGAQLVFH